MQDLDNLQYLLGFLLRERLLLIDLLDLLLSKFRKCTEVLETIQHSGCCSLVGEYLILTTLANQHTNCCVNLLAKLLFHIGISYIYLKTLFFACLSLFLLSLLVLGSYFSFILLNTDRGQDLSAQGTLEVTSRAPF